MSIDDIMEQCETDRTFRDRLVTSILDIAHESELSEACHGADIALCDEDDCGARADQDWRADDVRSHLKAGRIPDALYAIERRMPEIDRHFAQTISSYYGKKLP